MRTCAYPVPVRGVSFPTRRTNVARLRRASGDRFAARIMRAGRWVQVGVFETPTKARDAIVEALTPSRPCGADVLGDGELCYRHAKDVETLGADLGENGWRSLGRIVEEDRLREVEAEGRPAAICDGCSSPIRGAPFRQGWRPGERRFCSARCRDRWWSRELRRRRRAEV